MDLTKDVIGFIAQLWLTGFALGITFRFVISIHNRASRTGN